jgi:hypothetical protein
VYHVRCPKCRGRLFSSSHRDWHAIPLTEGVQSGLVLIKCGARRNGSNCGNVIALVCRDEVALERARVETLAEG